jgi:hypothetical protein
MPRRDSASTVGLREAASLLRVSRRRVLDLVESERLALHGVERGRPVFLREDVLRVAGRGDGPAVQDPLRLFLLPGESWAMWCAEIGRTARQHGAAERSFERHRARRDRPALGEGPRVVWLRVSGVRCAGCDVRLSSGRDQVRIESCGERWWLCAACGAASGAVLPEPMRRRVG